MGLIKITLKTKLIFSVLSALVLALVLVAASPDDVHAQAVCITNRGLGLTVGSVQAAVPLPSVTWAGAVDTNWFNAGNWSPAAPSINAQFG